MASKYEAQAAKFAKKYGVKLEVVGQPTYTKHFFNDTSRRWQYKMKLSRGKKSYTFNFGQSIAAGKTKPGMYDVLAAMTKYDVGTYSDFLGDFGYDRDPSSKKIYLAVCKEYKAIEKLFGDCLDELSEIA